MDPEELFRRIFGDIGMNMSGFQNMRDFEESKFGFAPATEVRPLMCMSHVKGRGVKNMQFASFMLILFLFQKSFHICKSKIVNV